MYVLFLFLVTVLGTCGNVSRFYTACLQKAAVKTKKCSVWREC